MMTSNVAIAVDVVNVTVAEAEPDETAVVMLSAVAAALTQPTQGVFTRPETVSLLVKIATPSADDAKAAARGSVLSPLHVTVTEPAGMFTPAPVKATVTSVVVMLVVHDVDSESTQHAGVGEVPNNGFEEG